MVDASKYISITGLKVRSPLAAPFFWMHAVPAMIQAQNAAGNIIAEARTINNVHHTLSVWTDQVAMKAYLYSGAHLKAINAVKSMATGKTFGFEANRVPSWDEVHELWKQQGREYE
jgi:quinol monooxygenase YgiN